MASGQPNGSQMAAVGACDESTDLPVSGTPRVKEPAAAGELAASSAAKISQSKCFIIFLSSPEIVIAAHAVPAPAASICITFRSNARYDVSDHPINVLGRHVRRENLAPLRLDVGRELFEERLLPIARRVRQDQR